MSEIAFVSLCQERGGFSYAEEGFIVWSIGSAGDDESAKQADTSYFIVTKWYPSWLSTVIAEWSHCLPRHGAS